MAAAGGAVVTTSQTPLDTYPVAVPETGGTVPHDGLRSKWSDHEAEVWTSRALELGFELATQRTESFSDRFSPAKHPCDGAKSPHPASDADMGSSLKSY